MHLWSSHTSPGLCSTPSGIAMYTRSSFGNVANKNAVDMSADRNLSPYAAAFASSNLMLAGFATGEKVAE